MHQRCVTCPVCATSNCAKRLVYNEALCAVCPARGACPALGAQCPVKGHYWTPGASAQKERLVRKARSAKAGHGAPALRKGHPPLSIRVFPSVESISLSQILVPRCQALRKKTSGHFPRWFILPTGRSLLWKCFPAPTSNKYWKCFLSFGDRPKNNGGQRGGWSPATQTRRPKGRLGESTNQR